MLGDLLASRELAWRLIVRNFSAQYRQSALGYVWAGFPKWVEGKDWPVGSARQCPQLAAGGRRRV